MFGCGSAGFRSKWLQICIFQGYLVEDQPCSGEFDYGSVSLKFVEPRICIMQVYSAADLLGPGQYGCGATFPRYILLSFSAVQVNMNADPNCSRLWAAHLHSAGVFGYGYEKWLCICFLRVFFCVSSTFRRV